MSKTLNALLSKGIDSEKAMNIVKAGYTIQSLATCGSEKLKLIGIDKKDIELIYSKSRPSIPDEILDNLLYKSRRTCCICREKEKSIIIHHLIEWHESRSHSEDNLVVLCLYHHDEAHTKKELSLNLTPERIKNAKIKWEAEIETLDKGLRVIPKELASLKEKWFKFLQKLNMKIEISESSYYDFKIHGRKSLILALYEILWVINFNPSKN
jgi:hypothetical protein